MPTQSVITRVHHNFSDQINIPAACISERAVSLMIGQTRYAAGRGSPRHDSARAHGHLRLLHQWRRPSAKAAASKAAVHAAVHPPLNQAPLSRLPSRVRACMQEGKGHTAPAGTSVAHTALHTVLSCSSGSRSHCNPTVSYRHTSRVSKAALHPASLQRPAPHHPMPGIAALSLTSTSQRCHSPGYTSGFWRMPDALPLMAWQWRWLS